MAIPASSLPTSAVSTVEVNTARAPRSVATATSRQSTQDKYNDLRVRDLNSGVLDPETEKLVDAVLTPDKAGAPKVLVKTFAVDGIQSKDIIYIERVPAEPNRPNSVLFIPDTGAKSFQSFNSKEDMNTWLKDLTNDRIKLQNFSSHFHEDGQLARNQRVDDTLIGFKNHDINAVIGPYATEQGDIFTRLDKPLDAPPSAVNGLTKVERERESTTGRAVYSGYRPDGEKVLFEYDAYGNLLGRGNKGNFYFVKNAIDGNSPLKPITGEEFKRVLNHEVLENLDANASRGFYDSLLTHLEHPFEGIGDVLQLLGVDKSTADTVERYIDNPVSALLLDLNKNNQIGKNFGLDKETMDSELKHVGDFAQGFVPAYGQARNLGRLLSMALKNQPLTDQDTRDFADALGMKPDSPARKNIPSPPKEPPIKAAGPGLATQENSVQKPAVAESTPVAGAGLALKEIEFEGRHYFVANKPDAGDGVHYLLRIPDPRDPSKWVSSSIVAKPNEVGVWKRRGVEGGGPGSSKMAAVAPQQTLSRSETFMENLLKQRSAMPGANPGIRSVAEIKAADFSIPPRIYRAHTAVGDSAATGLRRAAGTTTAGDDYLAAIIKHTARQGGSGGEVMSFSTSSAKADSFARAYSTNNNTVQVFTVDTTKEPGAFRTVADIILKDGERLITEKKITRATLLQATDQLNNQEFEVFYIKGDVPAGYIVT